MARLPQLVRDHPGHYPNPDHAGAEAAGWPLVDVAFRCGPMIHRLVRRRFAKLAGEVEDIEQETYLKLLERVRRGDPAPNWHSREYVLQTARNVCLDRLDAIHSQRRGGGHTASIDALLAQVHEDDGRAEPAMAPLIDLPSILPADVAEGREQQESIRRALLATRREYAQVWILTQVRGYSQVEVAERLGQPVNTIATWARRGRLSLVQALQYEQAA